MESATRWERVLVLVELGGGNDGLNTVVPYADGAYYEARRNLAVPREKVLQLDASLGLHPALEPLWGIWRERGLAVVSGVGYPQPNRSHFRSIEIWETASESAQVLQEGWLARLFASAPPPADFAADGIVIGRGQPGPLAGPRARTIMLSDPQQFLKGARRVRVVAAPSGNGALDHILAVERNILSAADSLRERLEAAQPLKTAFPKGGLSRQLEAVSRLMASGVRAAVYKVAHTGFDTHSNQRGQHERLLKELAEALAAFRAAQKESGLWDKTLVLTYSEFGRRVRENGSSGTDHGTAAPHFLLGGRVRGGLYGKAPSLESLDEGDLRHAVDYRTLYATVARRWWGLPFLDARRFPALDCLA